MSEHSDGLTNVSTLIGTMAGSIVEKELGGTGEFGSITGGFLGNMLGRNITSQWNHSLTEIKNFILEKFRSIPNEKIEKVLSNPVGLDFIYEGLLQGCRATTTERRRQIAEALKNGIENEDNLLSESKHLLKIFGELNDREIIHLYYLTLTMVIVDDREWKSKYPGMYPDYYDETLPRSENERRKMFIESYENNLVKYGLIQYDHEIKRVLIPVTGSDFNDEVEIPDIDYDGRLKVADVKITILGKELLNFIGKDDEE